MFSTETIYTCNSVNFTVTVDPITLLRSIQEAGYRGDGSKKFHVMSKYVCMTPYTYFNHDL